jgi:hypothetical protein
MGMDIGTLTDESFVADVEFMDGVTVRMKYVPRDRMAELVRKATAVRYDRKTHRREEEFDPVEGNVLLGEAAVVGWSGLEKDGKPFPFTTENRDLLMRKWGEFSRFVNDVCVDLEALTAAAREESRGNCSRTSGPDATCPE